MAGTKHARLLAVLSTAIVSTLSAGASGVAIDGGGQSGPRTDNTVPAQTAPEASVADQVKKIVIEHLGVEEKQVTPGARFIEDLHADSLDTVELVMAFEEQFSIEIPDEDACRIKTIGDAVDYLEAHAKR